MTGLDPSLNFSRCQFISFDCYGTLIDWETGILSVLRPIFAARGAEATDSAILTAYAELECEAEAGPYRRYRAILEGIVSDLGQRYGFIPSEAERQSLPESISSWQPFADTVSALRNLKRRFRLGILSNIDDDLFAATARLLEVDFDLVVTAQQVGSYKPSLRNFAAMRERLAGMGIESKAWIHAAQSRIHDVEPARALGIANVWVNRPAIYGAAAVTTAAVEPDRTVGSLAELAAIAGDGQ
jgi:2-haloacid dehalogenase